MPILMWWEAIDRCALPARFPRQLGLGLGCLLLLAVAGAVLRAIAGVVALEGGYSTRIRVKTSRKETDASA